MPNHPTLAVLVRCAPAGLRVPDGMWTSLAAAYASPGRAYHTLEHAAEVAQAFEDVARGAGWERPVETYLAVLYHDAVYVPGAGDNERRSAYLAREDIAAHLGGWEVDAARVCELVLLTARHGRLVPADVDRDAALFLDCDMAILAAAPERFDAYDAGIATEYADVPRAAFLAGRRAFLEGLLGAPRIFLSEHMHERLDAAARENLRRALAQNAY